MANERVRISTGTPWENMAAYSRAIRVGSIVEISGTTAVNEEGEVVGFHNVYEQTRYILMKIEHALEAVGASLNDVVRTRIYLVDIALWEWVARAHKEVFEHIRPVTTMVEVSGLIHPDLLVEIEATAIISDT